ncbi:GNAT family N-acetyltransferase [Alkaliphilus peptidifermentans]|uniref:Protein N-acetyltransferase, RimJ/RimL family n=1 Tax=Alkaliphilus peptidifermentans DSM 18978 TaxID=1120976 RepID=A0A1G5HFZ8_9FIRM|nr:GNAT family N-acetyltransferase [Alkaliphilus peptidifermentans]SCY61958.1 Protein N-acetyltransferase, RimJ/RimL family [Alkaliphilus peptidifermentans DSM 18978]
MLVAWGKNTYIKKLERKHVDEMQNWGAHQDPLFYSYTFPKMNRHERDYWYCKKSYTLSRKCFVIYNQQHRLVGYIALREIKWLRRSSEFGIVFDPNFIDQGLGTDSLKSFISYYFEKMRMKKLILRVADFNYRAQRCYQNCGFKISKVEFNEFEDQNLPIFKDDKLRRAEVFFRYERGVLKCKFIHMYITREMYLQQRHIYPHNPPNTCA